MAAIPFMPLYVSDYLADTPHLSMAENGAYMMLIMAYWQRGKPLAADDRKLARIVRAAPDEWDEVKEEVKGLFTLDGDLLRHPRVDAELTKAQQKIEQAKRAGAASAATRAQRNGNGRSTGVEQTHQRNGNHKDTDTEDISNEISKPTRKRVVYPEDFQAFWKAYPDSTGTDKGAALDEWKKLTAGDRKAAVEAIPAFKRWLAKQRPDFTTQHPVRFLKKRRFDSFDALPSPESTGYSIGLHHPLRKDFIRYWESERKRGSRTASLKLSWYSQDRTVQEETEYPPDYTHTEAAE